MKEKGFISSRKSEGVLWVIGIPSWSRGIPLLEQRGPSVVKWLDQRRLI
jgi:hypothetical protein